MYVVAKTSDACLQDKPQEPLDCRDGSSCMQLGTISQTSQSEVAAVGRSPIGRDRVALGCLWILQGPALEEEAWEARESLDELPARGRPLARAGRGANNPTEARSIGCHAFYSLLLEPPVHASCPAAIGVELRSWRADFHLDLQQYHRVENTSCHVVCCCCCTVLSSFLLLLLAPHDIAHHSTPHTCLAERLRVSSIERR